ncbi:MAG: HlyD family efflux transporter periplasmic adaptor subunit [Bacteroidales bacterium]|jgi:HlyD family secretion protein|nr:HlyD family efflux transporter periplasmic adaptor subunit [Bacteroidales bacterium]
MRKIILNTILLITSLICFSCFSDKHESDAYGVFEAKEIMVSSENNGKLLSLNLEEGDFIEKGVVVGCIDTFQLYLQYRQLELSITAALTKRPDIPAQLRTLQEKLNTLEKEQIRVANLVEANAVSTKKLDDVNAEITMTKSQIQATKSTLNIQTQAILEEVEVMRIQMLQVEDALSKCHIKNPLSGTVLKKYIEVNELVGQGRPLFKIADLTNMYIKIYVTEDMLSSLKIGQETEIRIDTKEGKNKIFNGNITWISPKAEFTPKMIQTKDERVNLVYAVKVSFVNDGSAKIGMPGDVVFKKK